MICWKIACILSALLSVLIALNTQEVLMDKRRKWFQAICRSLRNGPMCSQIHQKNKRIKMYPWVYIATRHQNHRILICSSDFLNCIFLRKQEQLVVCMDKIKMLLGKVVCVGAAGRGEKDRRLRDQLSQQCRNDSGERWCWLPQRRWLEPHKQHRSLQDRILGVRKEETSQMMAPASGNRLTAAFTGGQREQEDERSDACSPNLILVRHLCG